MSSAAGGCSDSGIAGSIPSLSPVFILTLPHSASGHLEVIFRDRKVVLVGNSRRIAQPLGNHVRGQPLLKLGLQRRPEVLERFRPDVNACTSNDLPEGGTQVLGSLAFEHGNDPKTGHV